MINHSKYLLLILFSSLSFVFSQTNVSGTISTNTTWDLNGSPYIIAENTVIVSGVTLSIDPGATVLFNQDVYLKALDGGTLIAQGTENDTIYFSVTDTNTVTSVGGVQFAEGSIGSELINNDTTYVSGSLFEYCSFSNMINSSSGSCVKIDGGYNQGTSSGNLDGPYILFSKCIFNDNQSIRGGAIFGYGIFYNTEFTNNFSTDRGGALYLTANSTFINCIFKNNYSGTGGAIYKGYSNDDGYPAPELQYSNVYNCKFYENSASNQGGVIGGDTDNGPWENPGFSIENSHFENNSASNGAVVSITTSAEYYGLIYFLIDSCVFIGNYNTTSGGGGGLFHTTQKIYSHSVTNNKFINNYITHQTSLFHHTSTEFEMTFADNIFYGNYHISNDTDPNTLVIYTDAGNNQYPQVNLINNLFIYNISENGTIIRSTIEGSGNAYFNNSCQYILKYPQGLTSNLNNQNNYWGTKLSTVIDNLIYDFNDDPDFNTPIADYTPFLLASPASLLGSPSSITGISLKTDFTYQTSLVENIDPSDTLFIELTGVDTDTLVTGLDVVLVINTMTQDTVIKTLVESSESSGVFRGEVYTSTNTDNINDIIEGQDGQVLKVISRANPNQQSSVIIGEAPLPIISNFNIDNEIDLTHVLNHAPLFKWSYYDPLGTMQASYHIQISSDENFSSIDIWDSNVVSSSDTSVVYNGNVLNDGLTYYARLNVVNTNSLPSNFLELSFRMNSMPTAPLLISPINDQVTENPVILNVLNSSDAEEDEITYSFNIYDDVSLTNKIDSVIFLNEYMDSTSWQVNIDLPDNGQYFWNASTNDGFEESVLSDLGSFLLNTDNNPPNVFSLSISMVNTSVQSLSPLFSWHPSIDPDPIDTISYTLLLDIPDPGIEVYQIGTDTSFLFPTQLIDNTQYFWQVIASDLLGFQTVSEGGYQTFFINMVNDPPTPSTLVAPLQGSIQTDIRPSFYWVEANDPDPLDHLTYSIEWWPVNETDVMFIEHVDTNTFTPEFDLSDNAKFGWRVIAKDIEGLSSMTDSTYFFTDAFPEPPLAFSTVYPENNAEGLATSIDFAWNKTTDPDPLDQVTYQLVYGTDWQDSSTYVFSDIITDTSISVLFDDNIQYYWIVVARDADGFIVGSNNDTPNMVTIGTLSVDGNTLPTVFALHQNYPNPFNPNTKISYDLPEATEVSLSIYDLMGREIRTLLNSEQNAGFKILQWNATDNLGKSVPAGMYIYTIQAGEFRQTRKMVLLK